jgi:glycerol uptake facilitator-like aquaporin
MSHELARKSLAEALGTALLLAAVIGSGVMAERLAQGNVALALLANSVATGAALVAILLALAPISGAHINPAVTLAEALRGALPWAAVPSYLGAQVFGAFLGTVVAHAMFELPLLSSPVHARTGAGQWLAEFIATFGLLITVWGSSRAHALAPAFAVGGYITAAYWFTSSTSFANPAVTLARAVSDTFAGIRPSDAPIFVVAQLLGAVAALGCWRILAPPQTAAPTESRP